jgi:hypothetical protein
MRRDRRQIEKLEATIVERESGSEEPGFEALCA